MSGDINLLSFNGPHDNGRFVDLRGHELRPSADMSDTIKCSTELTNFTARFGIVYGGREDALDINNRCRGIDIWSDLWVFEPSYSATGFTFKGGSQDLRAGGVIRGDPLVDIGNASDQSHELTTGVRLNFRREDGKAVRVRVLGGTLPVYEPTSGPYRYIFPGSWLPFCHLCAKVLLELRRKKFLRLAQV